MSEPLGEQLTKLNHGDSVTITVDGARYDGEVIEADRWMCELNQGFVESGAISIKIELSAETISRHNLPGKYILISATETAPQSWDVPKASVYETTESETESELGAVTELTI